MKISELIVQLKAIQEKDGDLPVYAACDDSFVQFPMTDSHIKIADEWFLKDPEPRRLLLGNI